jgi:Ca2+-binding EF-hand superfamily protein
MKQQKFLAASMVALGLTGSPAIAQDAMRADADAQFAQLDRDSKGYLTRDDVVGISSIARRFVTFDANKDGKLDRVEFAALMASLK